jgi:hypothetical protein
VRAALLGLLVCALAMLALPGVARAQAKGAKKDNAIAVIVEGDDAKKHRDLVVAVVPEGLEVIGDSDFKIALRRAGLPGQMGFALTSPTQRPGLVRIIRRAVKSSGVRGAVVARVKKAIAGRRDMTLVFVDESDDLKLDEKLVLKGPDEADRTAIEEVLGPVLASIAPPPPEPQPEPTPTPEPGEGDTGVDDEEEEEEDDGGGGGEFEPNTPGAELFSIAVGVEFAGRFFDYSQNDFNSRNTRPYSVCCAPGILVGAEVYPAATTGIPVLRDVGLTFSYMHAFGVSSQTEANAEDPNAQIFSFDTFWNRLTAGLRVRFRMVDDPKRPWIIAVSGNFGFQNFEFEAVDDPSSAILDEIGTVNYLTVRPAIDARLPVVEWLALMPSFGFIVPLSSGDECDPVSGTVAGTPDPCNGHFYNRFRDASAYGIDLGLAFAFVLPLGFEARGGVEYARYFSSFDPVPGDAYVAGGALDQFLSLRLGAAYLY